MAGIGITLDDLGIDETSDYPESDDYYPFYVQYEFDFALGLYGSWRKVRDGLRGVVQRIYGSNIPLSLIVLLAEREGDTEESIQAVLSGTEYSDQLLDAFTDHIERMATYGLDERQIRNMMAPGWPKHWAITEALAANENTPLDVLEELASLDDDSALNWRVYSSILRNRASERVLLALIGKVHHRELLEHPACTDNVRSEMDRQQVNGGALLSFERDQTADHLKKVRSAIKSGRTGGIVRRRGGELALLESVQAFPNLPVGLAFLVLEERVNVYGLAERPREPWVVAELAALGVAARVGTAQDEFEWLKPSFKDSPPSPYVPGQEDEDF